MSKPLHQMQQWLVQTYRSLRKQSALNAVDVAYVLVGKMQLDNLTQAPVIKINNNKVETAKASAGLGYVKSISIGEQSTCGNNRKER